jgi:hypothetical protein
MRMDGIALLVVLVAALMMLHGAHRLGGGVHELVAGAVAAFAGAGVAAWFRRSVRWLLQLVSGALVGTVSGPILIYWMEWPDDRAFALFAGSLTGMMGFSAMELILSPDTWRSLKAALLTRIAGKAERE